MDELIKMVAEKADVPEDKAKAAVEVVLEYLEANLPGPVASQIDTLLKGADAAKGLGDAAKGLGGLLGR